MGTVQSQLSCLGLKIKMGMIQEATVVHSDSGHAKEDKLRENGAKTKIIRDIIWTKRVINHTLDINFIA